MRLALGARADSVIRFILVQGFKLTLIGLAAGLVGALVLSLPSLLVAGCITGSAGLLLGAFVDRWQRAAAPESTETQV